MLFVTATKLVCHFMKYFFPHCLQIVHLSIANYFIPHASELMRSDVFECHLKCTISIK